MKKYIYVITFIAYFVSQSLTANSPMLLNAQPGWSDDQRLVFLPGDGRYPRAACFGDTVHLVWYQTVWYQDYPLQEEVFYKRSTDCGLTWGEDVMLSIEDDNYSILPSIDVHDKFVHVVWQDAYAGVCYRKSTDAGVTWLPIDTLPNTCAYPWIHVDNDHLYVVCLNDDEKLVFTKSTDNGATWQIGQEIGHVFGSPRIKKIGYLLAIVHQIIRYSVEIYCVRSTDDGQTWDSGQYVSEYDSISGQWPSMDVDDSGGIHVTWFDYKYTPYAWTGDIFHRVSRDSGEIWEEIDSLTVMHRARASDILAEGNNLHLVWEDDRHGFGDNFEIYYRMSRDLGHTWESEVRLTNALNNSNTPSLACGGGYLHLFWRDGREYESSDPGSSIYYKRKDLSHSITESHKSSFVTNLRIDVYPNPFSQILNIKSSQLEDKLEIKIFDACGKEVMDYEVKNKLEKLRLDTQHMSCGVYFVQIKVNGERVMKKVVKLH